MSAIGGPNIVEDGLVLALDAANVKSFRGVAQTNLLTGINHNRSNTDTTNFKVTNGIETINVPSRGIKQVKYVDIYNNHNNPGSTCCPSLFNFGTNVTVNGSTQYTYSIVYKTNTGYNHPNYMYRYEYNNSTYITEGGVHNINNRTHLGDGWYHAWGIFTTQPNTNRLTTFLFHYEYGIFNRVYVESVQLIQGNYISAPQHMLEPSQVRGTTVATGGGWADRSGNGNNGELVNGPTFDSGNGGSIAFDGVDDYVSLSHIGDTASFSYEVFIKPTQVTKDQMYVGYSSIGAHYIRILNSCAFLSVSAGGQRTLQHSQILVNNQIYQIVSIYNGIQLKIYVNNVLTLGGVINQPLAGWGTNRIGRWLDNDQRSFVGNIYSMRAYNRELTPQEILQNYNATKGRYGL